MYGLTTRNPEELALAEFARGFYEVKDVTGRHEEPVETGVNMVSCFGDNAAAEANPDFVPVDVDGNRATREQPCFDWAYICPNVSDYRRDILATISECASVNEDVRLDDVGFPRHEYCRCQRCEAAFRESASDDWGTWRTNVITEFVAEAADRIPGRTYFTLYPDPYPGHLSTRAGIDVDAIAQYVDEFIVPLYDLHYGTTYWLEVIATGFVDFLPKPFSIELYAVNVELDNLIHATEVAETYADTVLFAYDAATARAVVERRDESRDGAAGRCDADAGSNSGSTTNSDSGTDAS